jgi:hypothetical protein
MNHLTPNSVPEELQALLKHEAVFAKLVGLPPNHLYDHFKPLIAGAQPINKTPYRYTPQLKTEIEQQIQKMLVSGVIRFSNSAFSSPIILVRTKDNS